ncbi:class I SAM-dependent methyltransferase [Phenylobacterium sp.]|jgi:hypothetical protein|uniref:class I SAM-dependent methyltransferase n=1 Tax=Phenylobacterium sp. TaxID=1871053 RepID=UPI002F407981
MDNLSRYLTGGLSSVGGWLNPVSATFISSISQYQRQQSFTGSSGEIGVHHGKLFLILHMLSDPDRPSFAVDLFEQQNLNADASGKGDYDTFRRNLEKWTGRADAVKVFQGSSLELDPSEIVAACGRSRLFSVDGGHTIDCTRNDLQIAEAVSEPHGVVVIDDVFNEFFPEVSIGLQAYMVEGGLRPFAITPNKLYLSHPQFAGAYRDWLRSRWDKRYEKTSEMYGSQVDLFGVRFASYPEWKRVLRDSPLYPALKRFKSSLIERD